jgi:carbamoyltransferase
VPHDATTLLQGATLGAARRPPAVPAAIAVNSGADVISRPRPVRVLGLSFFFHDSAAALVSDGRIVAAAAEERFCRRKHTNEFPNLAIEYCLEAGQVSSINDIDAIVFYEKPILKLNRLLETLIEVWPRGLGIFTQGLPGFLTGKFNVYDIIQRKLPTYTGQILFAEHHLSHAASAFYCSPYQDAAILTIDGVGEWDTTAIGVGRGREIRLDRAIRFPHSVGLLYSALTSYLGFQVNDGEWKVMGLAPYGEPKYVDQFRRLVQIKEDGSFALDMDYFVHHYSSQWTAHNQRWEALFGFPRRQPKEEIEQRHEDLARSGQAVVEDIILNLARAARTASGSDNLVIAGGVGLNSVANWKIEREGIFKNIWIQPAAGDDGGALGAALLASHVAFDTARGPELTDAYLGPEYSERDVLEAVQDAGLVAERFDDVALVERAADLIAAGQVIGWFRGRMEFGPRALGSRSILADATNPEMKGIINQKIKYREYFRPFAPAVPLEDVHRYFDVPAGTALPFMLKVPQVRREVRELIPAVTHEDGTGRVQTVTREGNPLYYALLKAVERRTGVPIIVNTSFNVRGEPIVCAPQDAINCFLQTGIDALVLGNYLLTDKRGAELDVRQGYARSDALEAQIGRRVSGAAAATVSAVADLAVIGMRAAPALEMIEALTAPRVEFYPNAVEMASELRKSNRIKHYRPAHALLQEAGVSVADVGCGSGWFGTSCAYHYGARVTAVDANPVALKRARSLARLLSPDAALEFIEGDVSTLQPPGSFALVSALGGVRDAADGRAAIRRLVEWVRPGGCLQLGLAHRPATQAVRDYFAALASRGVSEEERRAEFARLNPDITDLPLLRWWFHDQILNPAESYDYADIETLLRAAGCVIEATSLNGFKPRPSADAIESLERRRAQTARAAISRKQRYVPGGFIVWARRG